MSRHAPTRYTDEATRHALRLESARQAAGHIVVIATGDRYATMPGWGLIVWWAIHETVAGHQTWTLCHGNAKGIDEISEKVSHEIQPKPAKVRRYDADWSQGLSGGPRRNRKMLTEAHDASQAHGFPLWVLAFHDDLQSGGGTYDCVGQARRLGIPTCHYTSDGGCVIWRPHEPETRITHEGITPAGRQASLALR